MADDRVTIAIFKSLLKTFTEQKYENEYDEYGGHYAEYQKHSKCGRKINYETEYAEYECGRSETDSQKLAKKKKQWCIRCSIVCLVLISGKDLDTCYIFDIFLRLVHFWHNCCGWKT